MVSCTLLLLSRILKLSGLGFPIIPVVVVVVVVVVVGGSSSSSNHGVYLAHYSRYINETW